ncbi:hypothetical protein FG386_001716 [Cryptosporidium ryanae]|uniref:uncharacterized protein n=1 Tax=Cryptosporidium ryanae TaxID=515981 RepID=UPI003519E7E8|nr:hypothetical protein FG386_001716 [Cryptosporidium ryanae]
MSEFEVYDTNTAADGDSGTVITTNEGEVPIWAIITTAVLSSLVLCALIAFVVIYFRERERTKTRERIERQFRIAESKKLTKYLQVLRERMMARNHNPQQNLNPNQVLPANSGYIGNPTVGYPSPPPPLFPQTSLPPQGSGYPVPPHGHIKQPYNNPQGFAFSPPVVPIQGPPTRPMMQQPHPIQSNTNLQSNNHMDSNVKYGTMSLNIQDPSLVPEGPPPVPPPGYVTVPIVLSSQNN